MYLQNRFGIPPPGCFNHFKEVDLFDGVLMGGEHEERESTEPDQKLSFEGKKAPVWGPSPRGVYRSASG